MADAYDPAFPTDSLSASPNPVGSTSPAPDVTSAEDGVARSDRKSSAPIVLASAAEKIEKLIHISSEDESSKKEQESRAREPTRRSRRSRSGRRYESLERLEKEDKRKGDDDKPSPERETSRGRRKSSRFSSRKDEVIEVKDTPDVKTEPKRKRTRFSSSKEESQKDSSSSDVKVSSDDTQSTVGVKKKDEKPAGKKMPFATKVKFEWKVGVKKSFVSSPMKKMGDDSEDENTQTKDAVDNVNKSEDEMKKAMQEQPLEGENEKALEEVPPKPKVESKPHPGMIGFQLVKDDGRPQDHSDEDDKLTDQKVSVQSSSLSLVPRKLMKGTRRDETVEEVEGKTESTVPEEKREDKEEVEKVDAKGDVKQEPAVPMDLSSDDGKDSREPSVIIHPTDIHREGRSSRSRRSRPRESDYRLSLEELHIRLLDKKGKDRRLSDATGKDEKDGAKAAPKKKWRNFVRQGVLSEPQSVDDRSVRASQRRLAPEIDNDNENKENRDDNTVPEIPSIGLSEKVQADIVKSAEGQTIPPASEAESRVESQEPFLEEGNDLSKTRSKSSERDKAVEDEKQRNSCERKTPERPKSVERDKEESRERSVEDGQRDKMEEKQKRRRSASEGMDDVDKVEGHSRGRGSSLGDEAGADKDKDKEGAKERSRDRKRRKGGSLDREVAKHSKSDGSRDSSRDKSREQSKKRASSLDKENRKSSKRGRERSHSRESSHDRKKKGGSTKEDSDKSHDRRDSSLDKEKRKSSKKGRERSSSRDSSHDRKKKRGHSKEERDRSQESRDSHEDKDKRKSSKKGRERSSSKDSCHDQKKKRGGSKEKRDKSQERRGSSLDKEKKKSSKKGRGRSSSRESSSDRKKKRGGSKEERDKSKDKSHDERDSSADKRKKKTSKKGRGRSSSREGSLDRSEKKNTKGKKEKSKGSHGHRDSSVDDEKKTSRKSGDRSSSRDRSGERSHDHDKKRGSSSERREKSRASSVSLVDKEKQSSKQKGQERSSSREKSHDCDNKHGASRERKDVSEESFMKRDGSVDKEEVKSSKKGKERDGSQERPNEHDRQRDQSKDRSQKGGGKGDTVTDEDKMKPFKKRNRDRSSSRESSHDKDKKGSSNDKSDLGAEDASDRSSRKRKKGGSSKEKRHHKGKSPKRRKSSSQDGDSDDSKEHGKKKRKEKGKKGKRKEKKSSKSGKHRSKGGKTKVKGDSKESEDHTEDDASDTEETKDVDSKVDDVPSEDMEESKIIKKSEAEKSDVVHESKMLLNASEVLAESKTDHQKETIEQSRTMTEENEDSEKSKTVEMKDIEQGNTMESTDGILKDDKLSGEGDASNQSKETEGIETSGDVKAFETIVDGNKPTVEVTDKAGIVKESLMKKEKSSVKESLNEELFMDILGDECETAEPHSGEEKNEVGGVGNPVRIPWSEDNDADNKVDTDDGKMAESSKQKFINSFVSPSTSGEVPSISQPSILKESVALKMDFRVGRTLNRPLFDRGSNLVNVNLSQDPPSLSSPIPVVGSHTLESKHSPGSMNIGGIGQGFQVAPPFSSIENVSEENIIPESDYRRERSNNMDDKAVMDEPLCEGVVGELNLQAGQSPNDPHSSFISGNIPMIKVTPVEEDVLPPMPIKTVSLSGRRDFTESVSTDDPWSANDTDRPPPPPSSTSSTIVVCKIDASDKYSPDSPTGDDDLDELLNQPGKETAKVVVPASVDTGYAFGFEQLVGQDAPQASGSQGTTGNDSNIRPIPVLQDLKPAPMMQVDQPIPVMENVHRIPVVSHGTEVPAQGYQGSLLATEPEGSSNVGQDFGMSENLTDVREGVRGMGIPVVIGGGTSEEEESESGIPVLTGVRDRRGTPAFIKPVKRNSQNEGLVVLVSGEESQKVEQRVPPDLDRKTGSSKEKKDEADKVPTSTDLVTRDGLPSSAEFIPTQTREVERIWVKADVDNAAGRVDDVTDNGAESGKARLNEGDESLVKTDEAVKNESQELKEETESKTKSDVAVTEEGLPNLQKGQPEGPVAEQVSKEEQGSQSSTNPQGEAVDMDFQPLEPVADLSLERPTEERDTPPDLKKVSETDVEAGGDVAESPKLAPELEKAVESEKVEGAVSLVPEGQEGVPKESSSTTEENIDQGKNGEQRPTLSEVEALESKGEEPMVIEGDSNEGEMRELGEISPTDGDRTPCEDERSSETEVPLAPHLEPGEILEKEGEKEDREKERSGEDRRQRERDRRSDRRSEGDRRSERERERELERKERYKEWGIVDKENYPPFEKMSENYYVTERKKSKAVKEARRMVCECTTSTYDRNRGIPACGENCLNRLLMIECTSRCPCGDYCTNTKFQKRDYADVGVFYAENKGHGLKALQDMKPNHFIMEYCGEILTSSEFRSRSRQYKKEGQHHFYFMALKTEEIIDATKKGNLSRFMNHSCDPNCETQKWTINGQLRVGFFTRGYIKAGTELTFDYQFEQYGEELQKCYCGTSKCRTYIGKPKKLRDPSTPRRRSSLDKRRRELTDLDEDIEVMVTDLDNGGLKKSEQTIKLARYMVRAETLGQRLQLLKILQETTDSTYLKLFLSHHGLTLIWSWMVDLGEHPHELKMEILNTLCKLPISTKNAVEDSKVLSVVERWAKEEKGDSETSSPGGTPPTHKPGTDSPTGKPVEANSSESESDAEKAAPKKKELLHVVLEATLSPNRAAIAENKDDDGQRLTVEETEGERAGDVAQGTEKTGEEEKNNGEGTLESAEEGKNQDGVTKEEGNEGDKEGGLDEREGDGEKGEPETKEETEPPQKQVCDKAASLLDSWSSLKEIYKIPKKESDRERERERDRDKYRDRDRDRDSRDRHRDSRDRYGRDRDRDRGRDRDRDRDRDRRSDRRRESRWDSDRSRDKDRDYKRRKRSHSRSPEKSGGPSPSSSKVKKTDSVDQKDGSKETQDWTQEKKISKEERRALFAKKVEEEEREREIKRQEEEREQEIKRQQEAEQHARLVAEAAKYMAETGMVPGYLDENGFPVLHPGVMVDPSNPGMVIDPNNPNVLLPLPTRMLPQPQGDPQMHGNPQMQGMGMEGMPPMQGIPPQQGMVPPEQFHHPDMPIAHHELHPQTFAEGMPPADHPHMLGLLPHPQPRPLGMDPILRPSMPPGQFSGDHDIDPNILHHIQLDQQQQQIQHQQQQYLEQQQYQQQAGLIHQEYNPPEFDQRPGGHPEEFMAPPLQRPDVGIPMHPAAPQHPIHPAQPMLQAAHQAAITEMGLHPPESVIVSSMAAPMVQQQQQLFTSALPQVTSTLVAPPADKGLMPPPPAPPRKAKKKRVTFDPEIDDNEPSTTLGESSLVHGKEFPSSMPQVTSSLPPVLPQQPPHGILVKPAVSQPPPVVPGGPGQVIQGPALPVSQALQHPAQQSAAETTVTFMTPDGMLVTQTIRPISSKDAMQPNLAHIQHAAQASTAPVVEDIPAPPPVKVKPKRTGLPPNWKTAKDSEGKTYYYHSKTRETQWDPPSWDEESEKEAETMDLGTPTYDEKSKRKTMTAAADTSSEDAKKVKDHFRAKMSHQVVTYLNAYRKPDCKKGRILTTEDFKHVARKLTHHILSKELKYCSNIEDLEVNENVKYKAREYIKKYMSKFGSVYKKDYLDI